MQVNTKKLNRLEARAEQANESWWAQQERYSEALSELKRVEAEFRRLVDRLVYEDKSEDEIDARWRNALVESDIHAHIKDIEGIAAHRRNTGTLNQLRSLLKTMGEINALRERVEFLGQEKDKASEISKGRSAYLPALRKFAEECGKAGGL